MAVNDISGYAWESKDPTCAHNYLLPKIDEILYALDCDKRLFELGCGNGAVANHLVENKWLVTGVDPSIQGIEQANRSYPHISLSIGSAYENLHDKYGEYQVVLSLEVVEHIYAPRDYAATLYSLVQPGGVAIISTPYHGYLKNLALALTGVMDKHFTALWDHGHIKFWSIKTLTLLLKEAGFIKIKFYRVGRIPVLAKAMIAVAYKTEC